MEDQNWQGGPVLAAKIGLARPILAADRFFRYRSVKSARGYVSQFLDRLIIDLQKYIAIQ